jgi:hypothetical protein
VIDCTALRAYSFYNDLIDGGFRMKAAKLRNHPIPTHKQLVEEQEEKMERLEDDVPAYSQVDVTDLEEQMVAAEVEEEAGTVKA